VLCITSPLWPAVNRVQSELVRGAGASKAVALRLKAIHNLSTPGFASSQATSQTKTLRNQSGTVRMYSLICAEAAAKRGKRSHRKSYHLGKSLISEWIRGLRPKTRPRACGFAVALRSRRLCISAREATFVSSDFFDPRRQKFCLSKVQSREVTNLTRLSFSWHQMSL